jgi:radical SAM superfamily enzyme YgiQ (UPF0313 family)
VAITDTAVTPRPEWRFDDPLFFGLTIYSNESIADALSLARELRERYPGVPLVWGGPHAQMVPEQTASHPLVDAVCYDEGEQSVVEIAEQISHGAWDPAGIRGLAFRDEEGRVRRTQPAPLMSGDDLPYPPYDLLDLGRYFVARQKSYYQSSRGCPFSCTFCADVQQRRWRARSPEVVLDHLARMVRELGSHEIYFSDANFFVDLRRARRICEGMLERGLHLRWSAFCRVDTVLRMDADFLRVLSRAGCHQLDIGGESGSDEVLRAFSKGVTSEMILQAVDQLAAVPIKPELSFIGGAPAESEEDFAKTLSLIDTIRHRHPVATVNGIFPYQPYPNSKLGAEAIARWELPVPRDLEGWSRYPVVMPRRECFPWLSDRHYRRMLVASYVASYRFLYGRVFDSPESRALDSSLWWRTVKLLLGGVHNLFVRWSIYLRWDRRCDLFPLEWKLFAAVRNAFIRSV